MSHRTKTVLAVLLQMLILAAIAGARQWTLATGTTVLFETAPVDPRDLFRGDYVTLNYKISTLDPQQLGFTETLEPFTVVYVGLENRGKYWEAVSLSRQPPKGVFIRGTAAYRDRAGLRELYGIESYFVPEGTGRRIEQSREPLSVEVVVGRNGSAVVRRLYVGDTPFP